MKSRIFVLYKWGTSPEMCCKHFTDWYDFADWLKQSTPQNTITIYLWEYVA